MYRPREEWVNNNWARQWEICTENGVAQSGPSASPRLRHTILSMSLLSPLYEASNMGGNEELKYNLGDPGMNSSLSPSQTFVKDLLGKTHVLPFLPTVSIATNLL